MNGLKLVFALCAASVIIAAALGETETGNWSFLDNERRDN